MFIFGSITALPEPASAEILCQKIKNKTKRNGKRKTKVTTQIIASGESCPKKFKPFLDSNSTLFNGLASNETFSETMVSNASFISQLTGSNAFLQALADQVGSFPGLQGAKGDKGDTGATGAQGAAGTNTTVFMARSDNLNTTIGTRFLYPSGHSGGMTGFATAVEASMVMPVACTAGDLTISLETAPGVGSQRDFTLMVNGSTTSVTCSITGTGTSCTSGSTVSISAGDTVTIQSEVLLSIAGSGNSFWSWTCAA